jgi:hypothetical protein
LNNIERYSNHVAIFLKVLHNKGIKVPGSFKHTRLAQEYYLLSKAQYEKKEFAAAAASLLRAMNHHVFLGASFIKKEDGLKLKLKKTFNPFAALFVYAAKTVFN